MPYIPSFSINTVLPTNPASIVITDTGTGSDVSIVSRRVSLYKIDGTLYVPVQPWILVTNPITLSVLTQDIALNVVVDWIDINGSVVVSANQIFAFTTYSEQFYYQLTQAQEVNPYITNDANYFTNKMKLRLYLDDAVQAVDEGADIFSAQSCLLKAIYMVQQHQIYFNV